MHQSEPVDNFQLKEKTTEEKLQALRQWIREHPDAFSSYTDEPENSAEKDMMLKLRSPQGRLPIVDFKMKELEETKKARWKIQMQKFEEEMKDKSFAEKIESLFLAEKDQGVFHDLVNANRAFIYGNSPELDFIKPRELPFGLKGRFAPHVPTSELPLIPSFSGKSIFDYRHKSNILFVDNEGKPQFIGSESPRSKLDFSDKKETDPKDGHSLNE